MLVAGVAALATAGFFLFKAGTRRAATTAPAAPAPSTVTIAVLPMVSVSPDSADAFLAYGLTDALSMALGRIPGVQVVSRVAAVGVQQLGLPVPEMAQRLGATHLVTGAVQRERNRLRVSVQLVAGTDGLTVWADAFDGSTRELLGVETSIAGEIAQAVGKELEPSRMGASSERHVPPPEATELLMKGRYALTQRGGDAVTRAITLFKQALAEDSLYADAWALLAQAYVVLPLYARGDAAANRVEGMHAAERALALDSTLASAHAALGNLYNAEWRWTDAAASLQRALKADSSYAPAWQWLGENRLVNGDADSAAKLFSRAVGLDSANAVSRGLLGVALALSNRGDAATKVLRDAIAAAPSTPALRVMRATGFLALGQLDSARADLEIAQTLAPDSPLVLGTLGYTYAKLGRPEQAALVEGTLKGVPAGTAWSLAKIALGRGDTVAALADLERAVREHDPLFASEPLTSPLFDPVRGGEHFARIVTAAGLDIRRIVGGRR